MNKEQIDALTGYIEALIYLCRNDDAPGRAIRDEVERTRQVLEQSFAFKIRPAMVYDVAANRSERYEDGQVVETMEDVL